MNDRLDKLRRVPRESEHEFVVDVWPELVAVAEMLIPFADEDSWHPNYDGRGYVFIPVGAFYEIEIRDPIERAQDALARLREKVTE